MAIGYAIGLPFVKVSGGNTPAVQAFINATGISNQVIIDALNQRVIALQSGTLWNKVDADYPLVGGNASAHSYNLKDTAQYQITWSAGGVTHDSNGITGNGSTGFGNTGYIIQAGQTNNFAMGLYSRTSGNNADYEAGTFSGLTEPPNIATYITCRNGDAFLASVTSIVPNTGANTDGAGVFQISRINSTQSIRNVRQITTTIANTSDGVNGLEMHVLALNFDGGVFFHSDRNLSSFYMAQGLTAAEMEEYGTIDINFQTALGRNV